MALQYDLEAAVALQESLAIEQAAVRETRSQEREGEALRRTADFDEGTIGTAAALSDHQWYLRQLRDHMDRLFLDDRHQARTSNEQDAQPSEHVQHTAAQRMDDLTLSQLRRERREDQAKDMVLHMRVTQATYEARLWTDIAAREGELRPGSAAAREYRAYAQEAREEAERSTEQRAREAQLPTRQPPVDVPLADLLTPETLAKDVFHVSRAARYERDHVADLPPEQRATRMASVLAAQREWVELQAQRMRLLDQAGASENPRDLVAMAEMVAYAYASDAFERWLGVVIHEQDYHRKTAVYSDASQHRIVANRAFDAMCAHVSPQIDRC